MADNVTTGAGNNATLPDATVIDTQQQTDGSHAQKIKIADGTKDSTSLLSISAGGAAKVDGSAVTQPISAASLPLPSGAATSANQSTDQTLTGAVTETAPTTDIASSGLNGRLQRIAQRLTTLITALGSPFQAGGSIGNTTFASTQSGTWTVQPGNTANTTAWKVDGSAVTQPVSDSPMTTSTGSTVASSASNVTLLAANSSRRMATIFNDSTQIVYVKFGATATTSDYLVQIAAGGYFEFPKPIYQGKVDAIWASANGNARLVEMT